MSQDLDFIPLGDRIVIEPDEVSGETVTPGGLIVPEFDEKQTTTGHVVALGPDVFVSYLWGYVEGDEHKTKLERHLVTGDRVVFSPWTGHALKLAGRMHVIVSSSDIMGIIPSGVPATVE